MISNRSPVELLMKSVLLMEIYGTQRTAGRKREAMAVALSGWIISLVFFKRWRG